LLKSIFYKKHNKSKQGILKLCGVQEFNREWKIRYVESKFYRFIGEIDRIRWKPSGFQNLNLDESIKFHRISTNLLKYKQIFLTKYQATKNYAAQERLITNEADPTTDVQRTYAVSAEKWMNENGRSNPSDYIVFNSVTSSSV
jgi:hypothetical protein